MECNRFLSWHILSFFMNFGGSLVLYWRLANILIGSAKTLPSAKRIDFIVIRKTIRVWNKSALKFLVLYRYICNDPVQNKWFHTCIIIIFWMSASPEALHRCKWLERWYRDFQRSFILWIDSLFILNKLRSHFGVVMLISFVVKIQKRSFTYCFTFFFFLF